MSDERALYRAYRIPTEWEACIVMRDTLRAKCLSFLELHEGRDTLFVVDRRIADGLDMQLNTLIKGAKQLHGILLGGTPTP